MFGLKRFNNWLFGSIHELITPWNLKFRLLINKLSLVEVCYRFLSKKRLKYFILLV